MLEVMYRMYEYLPPSSNEIDGIELDNLSAGHALCIEFDNQYKYEKVSYEEFDLNNPKKYLYKERGANPPTYTPTLRPNTKEIEKTLKNLITIIGNIVEKTKNNSRINYIMLKIQREIENNTESIVNNLKKHIDIIKNQSKSSKNDDTQKGIVLTLKIDGKHIGEIREFVEALSMVLQNNDRFIETKGNGVCSICGKNKEVSGNISPYTFYTIDKPGYIVGGMKKELSWKNFPLCFDCSIKLDRVRNYIESELTFTFVGNIRYHIIPDFIVSKADLARNIIKILSKSNKEITVDDKSIIGFTEDEKYILSILSDQPNYFVVNFLFIESQQARETIKLFVQDVYPSRIKEILNKKEGVDNAIKSIMELGVEDKYSEKFNNLLRFLSINMNGIYHFFTSRYNDIQSKNKFPFSKEFYNLVESIFKGIPFSEKLLIKIFMLSLSKVFKDPSGNQDFGSLVLKAYFSYVFIKLCINGGSFMVDITDLDKFLDSLEGLGGDPIKKGIFLTGVLAQRLIDYQEDKRNSRSFVSKLGSLFLNQKDIQKIFSQVRIKLEEYEEFKPVDKIIYEKASEFFVKGSDKWNLNIDEISFYFSVGLGMSKKVYSVVFESLKKENKEG